MQTYLTKGEGTLLLVMVEADPASPGTWPCQVLGTVSPWEVTAQPLRPKERIRPGERISALLTEVGIPANLLGHAYLRTGLELVLADGSLCHSMTRLLYPRIAKQHGTSAQGVERAIRHAIGTAWSRSSGAGYRSALGRLASYVGERPTNSEFIAQMAEKLMQG